MPRFPNTCVLLLLVLTILQACGRDDKLFNLLPSSKTGITFNNKIVENDSVNPLREVNIYNGGGVGAGDFNSDGLTDLYFTGNMSPNQLYINKGDMKFEDVTAVSGTEGKGRWSRGVAVVDINNDGKDDIYVCTAIAKDPQKRKNILYVNQGNNNNGIPVFKEMSAEYGLDDTTHSAMSYFFDYDNDGDLDMYLVVNHHLTTENQNVFRPIKGDGSHPSTHRLYRNDWSASANHPYFTNVSDSAAIKIEGYGHAAIISDFNHDGWKDIYVTNDFAPNNILYINNQNGSFTDSTQQYIKQTSRFAMGVDMQDFNNDGLLDIVELDMNPEDNWRKKMMLEANSYQTEQNFERYKYQHQYIRNTLQINQGPSMRTKDTLGNYVFSQVGFQSGIAETDWSWTPIVTDFDNDEFRDIIITNGYPKDVTDHDFMVYRSRAALIAKTEDILRQIPEVKLRNYIYQNNGDLTFANKTTEWGFDVKAFSNGGIYADLDNDGDMDVVINNINDEAFVYENTITEQKEKHYLNIRFEGDKMNKGGFGAWVKIYYAGKSQVAEHSPYRGYISTHQDLLHFGLGNNTKIDSLVVIWPNAKKQVIKNVEVDKLHTLKITDAAETYRFNPSVLSTESLFTDISDSVGVNYVHHEKDYPDFIIQKLMPHKFTEYSPALAAGDIDGNGLDDIVCAGNSAYPTTLFFQQQDGSFVNKQLFAPQKDNSFPENERFLMAGIGSSFKDSGILLFDADGDGDNDMYISSGGYAYMPQSAAYQDRFYVNDGKGNFAPDTSAIPLNHSSKFCVRASDFDRDGDLDLFVAGRVEPSAYPKPLSSMLLRNDSKNGKISFTDVTKAVAPELVDIGLVCDAVFSDFDNDGAQDLVIAGEFMPVTFFKNANGKFSRVGDASGINAKTGWWNSIAPGDFDNDGDIDYVVGNLGLNSFFSASEEHPLSITAKDFDANGSFDAFVAKYLPVSHDDTQKKLYPVHTRDEMNKQMIGLRRKYTNYKSYATVTMDQLFTPEELQGAVQLKANTLTSAYIRNDGGKFSMMALPNAAQAGVILAMAVDDFDGDGNLDVAINGNDYGMDVSYGRMDALNGLLLKGDGKGGFIPLSILESGIYIPGNGKAFVQLRSKQGGSLLAASQNNGPLKIFGKRKNNASVSYQPGDAGATVILKDGRKQKHEFYYGYSFLSQSAPFITTSSHVMAVEIIDRNGNKRTINVN